MVSFKEQEPRFGSLVTLHWEDGSECDCYYTGLDKTILPLPIHWSYIPQ